MSKKMINIQDIRKIVKLVLLSAYLKKAKPLSLLVVAKAGSGKTETIRSHKGNRFVFLTDCSYMGILDLLVKNPNLRHIIIPDYLKITMKRRSTTDNLTSLINAGVEEGIGHIKNFNYDQDFKGRTFGLVTSTTKDSFNQHYKAWKSMGFISRMIICSYDYKDETIDKILDYINGDLFAKEKTFEKLVNYKDLEVPSTKELNSQLNTIAKRSFRTLKQLQTLAKCNALLEQRKQVTQKDIDEVIRLSKYLNLDYTKL